MASALLGWKEGDFVSVTFLEGEGVAQVGA
jgi:hypothetical protein